MSVQVPDTSVQAPEKTIELPDLTREASPASKAEQILERAIHLIERGWTQHAFARTRTGWLNRGWNDHRAARFCLSGAIRRAGLDLGYTPDGCYDPATVAEGYVESQLPPNPLQRWAPNTIPSWNDTPGRTKVEVVAMLRKTLAFVLGRRAHWR